jgi:hypothetical protein
LAVICTVTDEAVLSVPAVGVMAGVKSATAAVGATGTTTLSPIATPLSSKLLLIAPTMPKGSLLTSCAAAKSVGASAVSVFDIAFPYGVTFRGCARPFAP